MTLAELGWDETFAAAYEPWQSKADVRPGRVVIEFNQIFRIYLDRGEIDAVTAGRLKHRARGRAELPAVGDWVVVRKRAEEDRGVIMEVLPRRSAFTRRAAGEPTGEQIVAANVDVVYLVMARESSASPAIVLTKPDLCLDLAAQLNEVTALAGDVVVHVANPKTGEGVEHLRRHFAPGRTAALLGSS